MTRRRGKKLAEEMVLVLRVKIKELSDKISALSTHVRSMENSKFLHTERADVAESKAITMYDAIRILAAEVPNNLARGRAIRQQVRAMLEENKISPPGTLGSSRNRAKKGRRKHAREEAV